MSIIPKRESMTVEFKHDPKSGLKDSIVIEAVVGLTNADGGSLYIGVNDNGEVSGVRSPNWLDPIRAAAFIASHTVPPVTVRVELVQGELPFPVMVIDVPKASSITATIDGIVIKRRLKVDGTPANFPLFPAEYNTRLSDLGRLDFTARVLPGAVYSDLDPAERKRFRETISENQGDRALLELDDEDFDKALHLATVEDGELRPTVVGLLMIGRKERIKVLLPTVGAVFQVFEGTALRVNKDINFPILASLSEIESGFDAWNFEHEYDDGLYRVAVTEFSRTAFREALLNAFTHRDYSCLGRISVRLLQEGLEITSPGGFISGVSLNNLLTVEPHGRNPALADCLKRSGLAERSGRGIDRIYEGSLLYGRPLPDYSESTASYVRVLIPRAEPDLSFFRLLRKYKPMNVPGRNALSVSALLILNALNSRGRLTPEQLSAQLSLSFSRVSALVLDLIRDGMVRRVAPNSLELAAKETSRLTFGTPMVDESADARILRIVKTRGLISRKDVVEELGVSGTTAYRLLSEMVLNKKLSKTGSGRWVKYSIPVEP